MPRKCQGKCLDKIFWSFGYYLWESCDDWVKAIQWITFSKICIRFPQVEKGFLSARYGFCKLFQWNLTGSAIQSESD